jgi:hypothetical protein
LNSLNIDSLISSSLNNINNISNTNNNLGNDFRTNYTIYKNSTMNIYNSLINQNSFGYNSTAHQEQLNNCTTVSLSIMGVDCGVPLNNTIGNFFLK